MDQLCRCGSSSPFRRGSLNYVPAIELRKGELFRVPRGALWPQIGRQAIVKSAHELVKVARCTLLMPDDEGSHTLTGYGLPIEASGNVGTDSHLPSLEHYRPDFACAPLLIFKLFMKINLRWIEH